MAIFENSLITNMRIFISFILMLFGINNAQAQYVFEHMNGKLIKVFNYNDSAFVDIKYTFDKNSFKNDRIANFNENLRFEILEKKGDNISKTELDSLVAARSKAFKEPKLKEAFINSSDVFAIHNPDGSKKVLYFYDPGFGNNYMEQEMQEFILGERDALLNYRGRFAFWGGVGFGAAAGIALQRSVFSVTAPFVWSLGAAIPVIRIKEKYMSDPTLKTEPYKSGFARTARTRNMLQGLKGSVLGLGVGILIYSVMAANSPNIN
jgi:hypothetical protein